MVGKRVFFFNIFPSANILGVPNYITRTIAIYLNLKYNASMYSMTDYFSCICTGTNELFYIKIHLTVEKEDDC